MSDEGFLRRWSRLKSQGGDLDPVAPAPTRDFPSVVPAHTRDLSPVVPAQDRTHAERETHATYAAPERQTGSHQPPAPRELPTLADVAALGPDSDYSAFVTQGVDKTVQRLAMKKLFSDPHFNIMDGLDVYIGDYTKPDPIPAAMLASLNHARSVFARMVDDKLEQLASNEPQPPPDDA